LREAAMSYPISKIPDIDAAIAARLKAQRIRTTAKLLESAKDARGRQALADQGHRRRLRTAACGGRRHGARAEISQPEKSRAGDGEGEQERRGALPAEREGRQEMDRAGEDAPPENLVLN